MKIMVWGINYWPELVGIGVYNTELCEFLSTAGHEVTMVSGFPYYPTWRKQPQDHGRFFRIDSHNQVTMWRCWQFVPRVPTVLARMVHEATFAITSFLRIATLPAANVMVVVGPPLLLGTAAGILSGLKKVPVLYHVQDLQPQAAVSLGMLKPGPFVQLLFAMQRFAYNRATAISSISQRMCDIMANTGAPAQKLVLLPNWTDLPSADSLPSSGTFRRKHSIDLGTAIVSYAGNLGVKQGLDLVIDAADQLKDKRILFVIAGNGGNESIYKRMCSERSIDNVSFHDVLEPDEHTALLVDSDLCIIPQREGSSDAFLPSKLLKILALAKPIVTNAPDHSALADAVDDGLFALKVTPGSSIAIADGILELLSNEPKRIALGQAGKAYVAQFERAQVLTKFESVLTEIARAKQSNHDTR